MHNSRTFATLLAAVAIHFSAGYIISEGKANNNPKQVDVGALGALIAICLAASAAVTVRPIAPD